MEQLCSMETCGGIKKMNTTTTVATLVVSLPEGISLQQAFVILNQVCNPMGIDFIFPMRLGIDNPTVLVRILKIEKGGPSDIHQA